MFIQKINLAATHKEHLTSHIDQTLTTQARRNQDNRSNNKLKLTRSQCSSKKNYLAETYTRIRHTALTRIAQEEHNRD